MVSHGTESALIFPVEREELKTSIMGFMNKDIIRSAEYSGRLKKLSGPLPGPAEPPEKAAGARKHQDFIIPVIRDIQKPRRIDGNRLGVSDIDPSIFVFRPRENSHGTKRHCARGSPEFRTFQKKSFVQFFHFGLPSPRRRGRRDDNGRGQNDEAADFSFLRQDGQFPPPRFEYIAEAAFHKHKLLLFRFRSLRWLAAIGKKFLILLRWFANASENR